MSAAPELHGLTGAYAAHALPEAERAAFERHLDGCPACVKEVAGFRSALARLGSADWLTPPPALKAQVMAGLAGIRQLPPPVGPAAGSGGPAAAVRTGRRTGRAVGRGSGRAARPGRLRSRVALAACLALAAGAGAIAVHQRGEAARARAEAARSRDGQAAVGELLTAADARLATAGTGAGAGTGTVVWSRERGQAVFLAAGLPELPPDRAYELWFDDAGTMRPAGLLPTGTGQLLLTGRIDGARGVGVTVEPSGGSARPSGQPVLVLPFT
ncbi:anti-sigma factor domain-containing protein [Kitasatospora sp. NPDC094019]|uniref:anti-sigma factor n=1 Tax=Kitasatospora sp. NPDC094019 TaxID=3364091 RepID=UPI0037F46D96